MKKYFLIIILIIIVLSIFVIFKSIFPIDIYVVKGVYMEPTFKDGDKVVTDETSSNYQRGDIVVMHSPRGADKYTVLRIVGLPGEKVEIREGQIFANGQALQESYAQGSTYPEQIVVLNNDQYYVLGDNRTRSVDSRLFGPVSYPMIIGKANQVYH